MYSSTLHLKWLYDKIKITLHLMVMQVVEEYEEDDEEAYEEDEEQYEEDEEEVCI